MKTLKVKQKKHAKSIFIFRSDLRLPDNRGLLKACGESEKVLPIFIFDPQQLDNRDNRYFAKRAFQFMIESLEDLDKELRDHDSNLSIFIGKQHEVVAELLEAGFEGVYACEDYTPFAKRRDQEIDKICTHKQVPYVLVFDKYLTRPGSVLSGKEEMYKVFTPFMKEALSYTEAEVSATVPHNLYRERIANSYDVRIIPDKILVDKDREESLFVKGGRKEALKVLKQAQFKNYADKRDFPAVHGTSRLSAYLRFGVLSVREVYQAALKACGTRGGTQKYHTELYWRDFYGHLLDVYPRLLGEAMQEKYRGSALRWDNNEELFEAWTKGMTGYPLVDAGMRELNQTGWMHNRVRMVTASFLTKHLQIDWRWGERYFAQKLVDYDVASNNGGWQWAASTGADAQPYFRIFNPWTQQEKFDPDCKYIKKYIPELAGLSTFEIHDIATNGLIETVEYPKPIVDHKEAREKALKMYKSV